MILEHRVESVPWHRDQRCMRCGELISEAGNYSFESGLVYQGGCGMWVGGVKPEYQNEVRPCRMH